ncbi:MAG: cytochrome c oxidase subunit I [Planctomycetota bacterium]|jgi:cytochrome c oxidase subunit 1
MSDDAHHHDPGFIRKYIFSTDHKMIGIQFLITSFVFLGLGGLLALGVRYQIAFSWKELPIVGSVLFGEWGGQTSPEYYTMMVTMHATVMIFMVIIPFLTGAFGNFIIPLQIGARDMAFPKLNMMSYWFMWPAAACMISAFFVRGGGPAAGWTSYPPLASVASAAPGSNMGQTLWVLGALLVGVSSLLGSVNYITTIIKMRAPGMSMFRVPLSTWGLFITAILQAFALPVLTVALIMQLLDRTLGTGFFVPEDLVVGGVAVESGGGQPLLWQHLFWFYSHPAVYIMILPAMGIVSDVISTFARKPLFGYKAMVYSMAGIAGLGFIVWGHHMFQSGMNPYLGATFMVTTVMIALPSAVKTFNWLTTIFRSRIQYTTSMLFGLSFVSMFIIGGLSGIFMAATPTDIFIHDTYYIVAHIHYVLFTSSLMGIYAGIYYWYPKMFGRMLNEGWGKLHFFLTFVLMNCTFFPMHIVGAAGLPRRYADYTDIPIFDHLLPLNKFMTVSALLLGAVQVIFVLNLILSFFKGKKAPRNPWNACSLEWAREYPLPHGNWGPEVPNVYRWPYEFSPPGRDEDFREQIDPPEQGEEPTAH